MHLSSWLPTAIKSNTTKGLHRPIRMATIEDLDRDWSPAMFDTDLDVSEEGSEYSHTLTKYFNEDLTLQSPPNPLDSQPRTPSRAPSLPFLISPEELASSPFIIEEILPKIWSQSSHKSSPRPAEPNCESHNPQTETRTWNELGAVSKNLVKVSVTQKRPSSTEDTRSSTTSLPKTRPRPSRSSCRSKPSLEREEKQNQASPFSPGVPSIHRLDLSKVEPRVRFPKDGYTPPKSQRSLRSSSLSPEPRLVYMSPADIVTMVLLNPSYGPEGKEETPGVRYILPPQFRSRQQAISLMNELQEDNYRLRLKCAEAATTIDWLRQKGEACERSLQTEQQMEVNASKYTPPMSGSLSREPHLVNMSSADIMTTVLRNPLDGLDPEGVMETPATLSILSPELRSRLKAISVMNDLQEDNYRLRLKCAEAATTIDQLRLEATVLRSSFVTI